MFAIYKDNGYGRKTRLSPNRIYEEREDAERFCEALGWIYIDGGKYYKLYIAEE